MGSQNYDIEYKFKSMTNAIDLFSQILSIEQICKYGFEFIVDTFKLKEAAIYILDEGRHKLINRTKLGEFKDFEEHSPEIDKIATFYGRTLTDKFDLYFSKDFIEGSSCNFIVPIIVESKIYGFILAGHIEKDYKDLINIDFIELIRKIFNISVYIAINKKNDSNLKKEIDKNIFKLSFINQSTKVLFSEIKLERLYQLCIDMIRELTSSSVTSFFLYDEGRSKLVLKGYNDILNFNKIYTEIKVKDRVPDTDRSVFHIREDEHILTEIFDDINDFKKLSAEYIILLKKDKIIGAVTVALAVNDRGYDKETLKQIESLAASIYISMMNALYVEEISMQKSKIKNQLDSIGRLNRIIKNINSCETLDEMMEISAETFSLSYGVNKGAIFIKDTSNKLELIKTIGFESSKEIILDDKSRLYEIEEFYFDFEYQKSGKYIRDFIKKIEEDDNEKNCIIIAPIKLDIFEIDGNGVLGYIVIWNASYNLKSNELVCIETLTNSMAPVVRQFMIQNQKMDLLSYDQKKLFLKRNSEMLLYKESYGINYRVYYKFIYCDLFDEIDLTRYEGLKYYYFTCILVYPVYEGEFVDESIFDGYVQGDKKNTLKELSNKHKDFVEILGKM